MTYSFGRHTVEHIGTPDVDTVTGVENFVGSSGD